MKSLKSGDLITCNLTLRKIDPKIFRGSLFDYIKDNQIKIITGYSRDAQVTLTIISNTVLHKNLYYMLNTVEQGLVMLCSFSEYNLYSKDKND